MPASPPVIHALSCAAEPDKSTSARLDLASLSHDMRSPLCAIELYNGLLRELEPDSKEREAYHDGISAQVKRLEELASVLVGHAKGPEIQLRKEGVNLQALLDVTVRLHASLHSHQGYEFDLYVPKALPYIFADRTALARVLDNLLDNAVKYSEPHRILLRAFEHRRQHGTYVVLEVQDQGPGIAPQHWQRLFDPYYRVGHDGPGTGLGLSIARKMVHAHKGQIEVDSTPGGGTTFRVLLPVEQASDGFSHTIPVKRHVYQQQ